MRAGELRDQLTEVPGERDVLVQTPDGDVIRPAGDIFYDDELQAWVIPTAQI